MFECGRGDIMCWVKSIKQAQSADSKQWDIIRNNAVCHSLLLCVLYLIPPIGGATDGSIWVFTNEVAEEKSASVGIILQ